MLHQSGGSLSTNEPAQRSVQVSTYFGNTNTADPNRMYLSVDSDFKELIVPEGKTGKDQSLVEFVAGT